MNRRTVFRRLAAATAAAWILPSCVSDPKKVSIALNNLEVSGDDEELLGDIADVIIPATDTPGARDVQAHLFTFVMVDDCLDKTERAKFIKGMRRFQDDLQAVTGKSFSEASPEERQQMLRTFEERKDDLPEEAKIFYTRTRQYILQGYLSSRHFLTDVKPYKLVPGPVFNGCIPVGESKSIS